MWRLGIELEWEKKLEVEGRGEAWRLTIPLSTTRVAVKAKPECCSEQNRNDW